MAKGGRRNLRTTALEKYALLEATGVYFDGLTAASREVVVRFGRATLTLQDFDDMPVAHWALAGLRRLDGSSPQEMRLAPDMDGEERLVIRDPLMIEAIEAVCAELDARPPRVRGRTWRLAGWSIAAIASVLLIVFVLVPEMAERLTPMIPAEQERALGETVRNQAVRIFTGSMTPKLCAQPEGAAALRRMTRRLLTHVDAHVPISVQVVRSDAVNAFAAPGGYVVLMSGLLDAAEGPEEVAAVLAHEFGHVVNRDPLREVMRAAGSTGVLGLLLGDAFGGAAIAGMAEAAINAAYTREAEVRADAYAHHLLGAAGLPAGAMADFFETLETREGEPSGLMRHLMSHPDLAGRAAAAREADSVTGAPFDPALDDAGWIALQQICG